MLPLPPPSRISDKFQETTALVKSHFLQNLHTTSTLPETSVYSPAKSIIDPWMSGKRAVDVALNVEVYAETFVENVLSKRLKARYWSAVNSAAVWAVERALGGGVVWVSSRFKWRLGLGAVKKMLTSLPTVVCTLRAFY